MTKKDATKKSAAAKKNIEEKYVVTVIHEKGNTTVLDGYITSFEELKLIANKMVDNLENDVDEAYVNEKIYHNMIILETTLGKFYLYMSKFYDKKFNEKELSYKSFIRSGVPVKFRYDKKEKACKEECNCQKEEETK